MTWTKQTDNTSLWDTTSDEIGAIFLIDETTGAMLKDEVTGQSLIDEEATGTPWTTETDNTTVWG